MAGGRGERFWPQSRLKKPKHLLPIVGVQPMLTQTIARVLPLVSARNIFVITTRSQLTAARAACAGLPRANIIVEPVGRDTAAAVGLAMLLVKARHKNAAFAVLPADHVIGDVPGFRKTLKVAFKAAESSDHLVTLGIEPTEPSTGFGYIERGAVWQPGPERILKAKRFVEKPGQARAREYLASGRYYWNAGMFIWRVPVIEAAFARHARGLYAGLVKLESAMRRGDPDKALARIYPGLKRVSIDYAVMEGARNVLVVPANFGWDDVGSWTAIAKHHVKDSAGNILRGMAFVEAGAHNIVISEGKHLTAVLGLDNLVVVHTHDATLICPKEKAQEIKALLVRLHANPKTHRYL